MTETALLFLHALTGLHPGSGTALGVVDLPVQRERHTGWPTIPGTSLKGVIRAEAKGREPDPGRPGDPFYAVFGPDTQNAADHAGAVAFTDARILAFPVRSLKGVFAWVTCPEVLLRLSRDLAVAGSKPLGKIPKVKDEQALIRQASPLEITEGNRRGVVLEEFDFTTEHGAEPIADWIAERAVTDAATRERIKSHLAVIPDDAFGHFVQHATEVTARIALDYETKTVRHGGLFYEEFLPPETLFYSLLIAQPARRKSTVMTAMAVLEWLAWLGGKPIQIGGGETIGKGLCAVRLDRAAGDRS
jgi:CRISPR-associated protein Cmr4